MNWIKTADRLPEDQNSRPLRFQKTVVIARLKSSTGEWIFNVSVFCNGRFQGSAGHVVCEFNAPDYWCEIERPE